MWHTTSVVVVRSLICNHFVLVNRLFTIYFYINIYFLLPCNMFSFFLLSTTYSLRRKLYSFFRVFLVLSQSFGRLIRRRAWLESGCLSVALSSYFAFIYTSFVPPNPSFPNPFHFLFLPLWGETVFQKIAHFQDKENIFSELCSSGFVAGCPMWVCQSTHDIVSDTNDGATLAESKRIPGLLFSSFLIRLRRLRGNFCGQVVRQSRCLKFL